MKKNRTLWIILTGIIIGVISVALVALGNPKNMGFCIACFIRDIAGATGLQKTATVQYLRPEIIGLVLGAFIMSVARKEYSARGGSSPMTRFVLGFFVMVGALMFLGCPLRMVLRLAGGDMNAVVGLVGFIIGILVGIFFLQKGFSLRRAYEQSKLEGAVMPMINVILLVLLTAVPSVLLFSEKGPGSMHAPLIAALAAGLIVGALAQKSRLCMVGGIRDAVLFKDYYLLIGFIAILISAFIGNLLTGNFHLGFLNQPIAHTDWLWNALGMTLVGFASVLAGGCPLRQLILTGSGNSDSAITVLGLFVGGAFSHNFGLASSATGPTAAGKIAVVLGILVTAAIGICNIRKEKA